MLAPVKAKNFGLSLQIRPHFSPKVCIHRAAGRALEISYWCSLQQIFQIPFCAFGYIGTWVLGNLITYLRSWILGYLGIWELVHLETWDLETWGLGYMGIRVLGNLGT